DPLWEALAASPGASLAGGRAGSLRALEAPAELPVSFSAYRRQQHRWARGSFECARKHLPAIWRSTAPTARKVATTIHLCGYGVHLLLLSLSLLFPLLLLVSARHAAP